MKPPDENAQLVAGTLSRDAFEGGETLPPTPLRFRLMNAAELAAIPRVEREYVFGDRIPKRRWGLAHGDSRSGKGMQSLNLAVRAAAGVSPGPCFGSGKRQKVVYVTAEDLIERMQTRQEELCLGLKISPDDIQETLSYIIRPKPKFLLLNGEDLKAFIGLLQSYNPDFLVMDHLSKLHEQNENAGEEMGPVMERVEAIRDEVGAATLLIHHQPKVSRSGVNASRGSTVIPNTSDYQLQFERPNDGIDCTVTMHGSKDDPGWKTVFRQEILANGARLYKPLPEEFEGLSEEQIRHRNIVWNALKASPNGATKGALAKVTQQSEKTVLRYLEMLKNLGLAEYRCEGKGKPKFWLPLKRVDISGIADTPIDEINPDGPPRPMWTCPKCYEAGFMNEFSGHCQKCKHEFTPEAT